MEPSNPQNPLAAKPMPSEITQLLERWSKGHDSALNEVFSEVYQQLRQAARQQLQANPSATLLSPTGLIHETFIRLSEKVTMRFENRAHFFWFAGELMRRILVEHARARFSQKRGGGIAPLSIDQLAVFSKGQEVDLGMVLAVDRALTRLENVETRLAKLVELRFFAGLSHGEIADILNISVTTVKRDWRLAKHLLARELHT